MNITTPKKELVDAVSRCCVVADPKATHPMGAYVLVSASEGAVSFASTDMIASVRCTVETAVKADGDIAVPARGLLDKLKAMDDGPVTLKCKALVMTISSKGSPRRYTMSGLAPEDFPTMPEMPGGFDVDAAALSRIIGNVSYASFPGEDRPHMSTVSVKVVDGPNKKKGSTTICYAADGHRFALAQHYALPRIPKCYANVPARGAKALRTMLEGAEHAKMAVANDHIFLDVNGVMFSSKTITEDAPFVPTGKEHHHFKVEIDRARLLKAVRSVALVSQDDVSVTLKFSDKDIEVSTQAGDAGEGTDRVPITWVSDTGETDFITGHSCRYMVEVLSNMPGQTVILSMVNERAKEDASFVLGASTFTPKTEKGEPTHYTHLMPRRDS
mgnify:CR=1 FL=1